MSRPALSPLPLRIWTLSRAEYQKIWASRIPLAVVLLIPVLTYAFVLELYHIEDAPAHTTIRNAFDMLPVLHFTIGKTLLFQAAVVAFAAFWTTLDSQYGMIRVACGQPISRAEYLLAKWCGIAAHVIVFAVVLLVSEVGWTVAYSGLAGASPQAWAAVGRFSLQTVFFVTALAWVGMAAASFRRTVGAGLVTAALAIVAIALMMMVPFKVLPPRFVFMRYFFFPLGELPNPWPAGADSPFLRIRPVLDFVLVVGLTPALVSLAALLHFRRRDITE